MIPDDIIEQVREAADLVGIIGETVELKRTGTDYRGRAFTSQIDLKLAEGTIQGFAGDRTDLHYEDRPEGLVLRGIYAGKLGELTINNEMIRRSGAMSLPEVLRMADRVTVLRDGAVVETGPAAGLTQADLIRAMVGRDLAAVFPKRALAIGDVALSARGLSCGASGVRGVDLEVRAGEILGLAGLVGSGRTELARTLFGLTPADGGELRIHGQVRTIRSPAEAIRTGLAYVPEDRRRHGVIPEMSVAANATLAILRALRSGPFLDAAREREIATTFVARFAIKAPSLDTPVAHLSGGNQQKVALARWLATRPLVLILDEPTQGVDVGAKAEIHRLIVDLAAEGLAIVMISSEMPEILGMSDRIAVMRAGTVVATLERAAATQERLLALALGHAEPLAS